MKPIISWSLVVCFAVALVGGFFLLRQKTSGASPQFSLATYAQNHDATPRPVIEKQSKSIAITTFIFFVFYPADIPAQEFNDRGKALTVAFQENQGDEGFQIYVAPINGTEITQERFLMDEPSGARKDETEISIDGGPAIAFYGFNADLGETYEVWFIRDGFLYEVSTYKELEEGLKQIMSTWRFL